jgi:hypothetical protein
MTELHTEIREANTYANERNAEYKAECRETAARIRNDIQSIIAQVEEVYLAWERDGLLDMKGRSRLHACAYHASAIAEYMMDARSDDAINAMEIV